MTPQFPKRDAIKVKLEQFKNESVDDAPELLVDAARAEMHLYGRIGPSKSGGVSGRKFAEGLKTMNGKDFTLFLNSEGGELTNGWSIGNQLARYSGKITGVCDGIAASVASFILCCCPARLIAPSSAVMVHNAWSGFTGNAEAMKKEAEILEKFSTSIHAKYVEVTGQTADQVTQWMDSEAWFFGDEAVQAGFCSGRYGQAENYKPRRAAAKRASLRTRMATLMEDPDYTIAASVR